MPNGTFNNHGIWYAEVSSFYTSFADFLKIVKTDMRSKFSENSKKWHSLYCQQQDIYLSRYLVWRTNFRFLEGFF